MATHNRPTAIVVAQPSRRSVASGPQIVRMAVPMLFAAMGVSLGTLAGVATAFFSVPMASAAAVDTNSGTQQMAAVVDSNSRTQQMASAAVPAEIVQVSSTKSNDSTAAQPAVEDSAAPHATKIEQAPETERARTKAPSIDRTTDPATPPSDVRPAKHLAHPVNRPLRIEVAAEPEVTPMQIEMEADQPIPMEAAKSPVVYSEGDITVEDYDAAQGTIQTTDGRTFELGQTVSEGNTVAWDQYRANVHYRCEGNGSCTLQREGVVTVNSRQI
jgi:hypothetical protein